MAKDRRRLVSDRYAEIVGLPAVDKERLGKLFARNSFTVPLIATRRDSGLSTPTSCRKAATYLISGMGRMTSGKESFDLTHRMCVVDIPELNKTTSGTYALFDYCYFVVSAADGQPVLV